MADRLIKRLLNRSIATIGDMREQAGMSGSKRTRDVLIDLHCHRSAG